jgi:methionyl-tRNA formyltransferase
MLNKPGPVKALATARGLKVGQPATLKAESDRPSILAVPLDVLVVAAYGLLLPPEVLSWPTLGCLNIHASLLPRWRGAAPIARALLAGDHETGISIMRMERGLDTGPVISRHPLPILPRDTAGSLHDKLAEIGAQAIVGTLRALERGEPLDATAQDDAMATYAPKLDRAEAEIDWTATALAIDRRVRAFDPVPGAQTVLESNAVKIWCAHPVPGQFGAPGTIAGIEARGILIACGDGGLLVSELQRAGGRRVDARAFLAGHPVRIGSRLGASAS